MKRNIRKNLLMAAGLLAAFGLWTAIICVVDVQWIGPQGSSVGLAGVNRLFHQLTGVHMMLYDLTDCLSLVPVGCAMGFALLGLSQWIRRKSILKVDRSLLVLGGFYIVVMAAYVFFEMAVINHRPVLIDGVLEASYPSSTTMLVLCVMPTARMQLQERIRRGKLRQCISFAIDAFTVLMVAGRLISGVHWLSDIIGGMLLSGGLVGGYRAVVCLTADGQSQ